MKVLYVSPKVPARWPKSKKTFDFSTYFIGIEMRMDLNVSDGWILKCIYSNKRNDNFLQKSPYLRSENDC